MVNKTIEYLIWWSVHGPAWQLLVAVGVSFVILLILINSIFHHHKQRRLHE